MATSFQLYDMEGNVTYLETLLKEDSQEFKFDKVISFKLIL